MFRMENWKMNMLFQKKKCLFFIVTEAVQAWQPQENLSDGDTGHVR